MIYFWCACGIGTCSFCRGKQIPRAGDASDEVSLSRLDVVMKRSRKEKNETR